MPLTPHVPDESSVMSRTHPTIPTSSVEPTLAPVSPSRSSISDSCWMTDAVSPELLNSVFLELERSSAGAPSGECDPHSLTAIVEAVDKPPIDFSEYMWYIVEGMIDVTQKRDETLRIAAYATILIRRVQVSAVIPFSEYTAHRLGLACLWLAQKFLCDRHLSSEVISDIGGVDSVDAVACERAVLIAIDWSLYVSKEELAEALHLPFTPILPPSRPSTPEPEKTGTSRAQKAAAAVRSFFQRIKPKFSGSLKAKPLTVN